MESSKTKSNIVVDLTQLTELENKYPAVSKNEFESFINSKCSFYSSLDYDSLCKYGFDGKVKPEWFEKIKEFIPLINDSYSKVEIKIEEKQPVLKETDIFKENEINFLQDDYWDSWGKVKGHLKKLLNNGDEFLNFDEYKSKNKFFFLSHNKDVIIGKPQLIDNVQKRIPLIRTVLKTTKEKNNETKEIETTTNIFYYLFDDKYDKRYDGNNIDTFSLDFWMYRVITTDGKEVFLWAKQKLPNQQCTFKGMLVEMDDFAELSNSMKVKSISKIFFMESFAPSVKILSKEDIVKFTEENGISEEKWITYLAHHPFGTYNSFPIESELLRSAQLLSSKVDGYPLHIFYWGPTGTRKSMGIIETIASKFSDDLQIVEGANSRIKGLIPSFKEKPANLGYLAKVDRMGWIDEIGKMVESEMNKHQTTEACTNVLGELNFLLDHKKRIVGSGNDNECEVEATAKFTFVSNPVNGKNRIYDHVGLIDPTTMSRMLHWVQDYDEQRLVLSEIGVSRFPPSQTQDYGGEIEKKSTLVNYVLGGSVNIMSRNEFLTIFDTCNSFLTEIDYEKAKILTDNVTALIQEPMKSSVWKPRGMHHVHLLIDGLCKHRCLFKDYDPSFKVKDEDYILANTILDRMARSWDTILSKKEGVFT
jgi:hypothetical protein